MKPGGRPQGDVKCEIWGDGAGVTLYPQPVQRPVICETLERSVKCETPGIPRRPGVKCETLAQPGSPRKRVKCETRREV